MAFFKDSVRTTAVRISCIFINVIAGIINARWLGPEGVGILVLFVLVKSFSFRFGNLGFGSGFAFFIARKMASSNTALRMAFIISLVMSSISCVLVLLIWKQPFSPWREIAPNIFYMSFFTIFPFFMIDFLQRILSGQLRIKAINISELLRSLSYLFILILFVIIFDLGILGAVLSILVSQLIILVYLLSRFRKKDELPDVRNDKLNQRKLFLEIWRYGRWNYSIMFANFYLEEFPTIFLTYFYPSRIIGYFAIGRGLMDRVKILPDSFSQILFPFTAASEKDHAVNRTNMLCRNFFILSIGVIIVLAFLAKPLITILYGEAFIPAVYVFYAFMPAILFWPFSRFLGIHIAASGNPKKVFWICLISLVASLAGCALLIPRYGAIGAGLSLSATHLILTVLMIYAYIQFENTNLSEILIIKRTDLDYYKKLLTKIPFPFPSKTLK